jgi:hypothetical protein
VSKHSVFFWKIFMESKPMDSTRETGMKLYALRTYSNLSDKKSLRSEKHTNVRIWQGITKRRFMCFYFCTLVILSKTSKSHLMDVDLLPSNVCCILKHHLGLLDLLYF